MKVSNLIIIDQDEVVKNILFSAHNKTVLNEQISKFLCDIMFFKQIAINACIANGKYVCDDIQVHISTPETIAEGQVYQEKATKC